MYISSSLNRFKSLVALLIGIFIVLITLPLLFEENTQISFYMGILIPVMSMVIAGLIFYTSWWAYKHHRDVFKPWLLISLAMISYSCANLLYFFFADIEKLTFSISLADTFYLAAFPLFIIGLRFFIKEPLELRTKSLLDFIIVMISAFFIVWFLWVWPIVEPTQPDTLSQIFSLAYLFLDLILLFAVLIVLFTDNKKIREPPIVFLAMGMFIKIFGDMVYAYATPNPSLIYDWLFTTFYLLTSIFMLLAVAAYLMDIDISIIDKIASFRRSKTSGDWVSYLPLILALSAYGLLIITTPDDALIWGVGIIVVLVLIRQMISLNEIKKAQQIISTREEQLSFITSNMLDLIIESDEKGVFKYVSPSSQQLLGYSPEYLRGKSFLDLVHPDDLEKIKESLEESSTSLNSARLQYRYKNAQGDYIWLESTGKPVFDEGNLKGFIYSSRDISERKNYEEFIKNSLKEKKESLKEKNALLREIHHRVNNNLQIIISLLNLQSRNVVDIGDQELFLESKNRVQSMAMIHENLYQSRNLSSINFSAYLKNLLTSLLYTYSKTQLNLELDIDEGIDLNIETSVPCGLIITEIVSNSLKYAFPIYGDKGKLILKLHHEGEEYVLVVGDDGVGMDKTLLDKNNSLGINLIKSLVDQLDADLELLEGKGTVYRITFEELHYEKRL